MLPTSSIGRKGAMAVTGALLLGFVIAHLAGNLQVFLGPGVFNTYAHNLESLGPVLWVARIGLLAIFAYHIYLGLTLARENKAARPTPYVHQATVQASTPSLTMVLTGLLILTFVIYHLAHFTFRVVHFNKIPMTTIEGVDHPVRDVFTMLVMGFRVWYIVLAYLLAQVVLGMHLSHGISSVFQTLGLSHPKYDPIIEKLGPALAGLIVLGYVSIPAAVFSGLVTLPTN